MQPTTEPVAARARARVCDARAALDRALSRRDAATVASETFHLAGLLVENDRVLAAASELEYAVEWLSHHPDTSESIWPMLRTLAALYDHVGDPLRARRAAARADELLACMELDATANRRAS